MFWIITITLGLAYLIILLAGFLSNKTVVVTNFSDDKKKNATVYYYLPESILKINATAKVAVSYNSDDNTLNESTRVIEQNFLVVSELISDTENLLSLNYKPNLLMSDEIKYIVNSNGLLGTLNVATEDRTSNLIQALAEAPQAILNNTPPPATKSLKTPGISDSRVIIKDYTTEYKIKVSSLSITPFSITWNIIIPNELGKDEFITRQCGFNISLKENQESKDKLSNIINGAQESSITEIDGILTRPLKNIELVIETITLDVKALPINVTIADVSKLIVIPVERSPFVKRVNDIVIEDGVIVSNAIKNPSSVEGFATIPISIAKSLISLPGELIKFRFDNTVLLDQLEKEKLKYAQSIEESNKYKLQSEERKETLDIELKKKKLTNDIELQKANFEIQKELFEAEKEKIKAEKEKIDAEKNLLTEQKKD